MNTKVLLVFSYHIVLQTHTYNDVLQIYNGALFMSVRRASVVRQSVNFFNDISS